MLFRYVHISKAINGKLYFHSMPGRNENFLESLLAIKSLSINGIVSLAPMKEIKEKSPAYAEAIVFRKLPCEHILFSICDYGVPKDRQKFVVFVKGVAQRLRNGEKLLMHCGAGIGRTGTVACCVLIELGLREENAESIVHTAGSYPETDAQRELVKWYAKQS